MTTFRSWVLWVVWLSNLAEGREDRAEVSGQSRAADGCLASVERDADVILLNEIEISCQERKALISAWDTSSSSSHKVIFSLTGKTGFDMCVHNQHRAILALQTNRKAAPSANVINLGLTFEPAHHRLTY